MLTLEPQHGRLYIVAELCLLFIVGKGPVVKWALAGRCVPESTLKYFGYCRFIKGFQF